MELSRRDFLQDMLVTGAAGGLLGQQSFAEQTSLPPNILYIMTDQQPVSCVGAFGNTAIRTPNLDRLAEEGILLGNMYIGAFPCSPSRACQLTGRYLHHHGVICNDVLLGSDIPSLGTLSKHAGYATGYFGKWHLGGNMYVGVHASKALNTKGNWHRKRVETESGWELVDELGGLGEDAPQHGFDTWAGGWKHYRDWLTATGRDEIFKACPGTGNHNDAPSGPEGTHIYSRLAPESHMAAFFAERASAFIRDNRETGQPWCTVLSFFGPHLPVAPPKPWDTLYSLDEVQLPANHQDLLEEKPFGQSGKRTYRLKEWSEEQFRDYVRRYWGYCSYIDEQIGRVLNTVRETGQWDRTAIVFTSDHGDMVSAHGMIFKLGACGYEELYRVPTILRIPGITGTGDRLDALASNIDLLPTLLEAASIPLPQGLDGRSLLPLLRGKSATHRDCIFADASNRSIICRDATRKYVLNWNGQSRALDELYDLEKDPGELVNLAYSPAHRETAQAMRDRIVTWLKTSGHLYAAQIIGDAGRDPFAGLLDLGAEVRAVTYLGKRDFEITIAWHVNSTPEVEPGTYWAFTHFLNDTYGKDGSIAFRCTPYPEIPFTQWKQGETHIIGPIRITIPESAGVGVYGVRTGFYDPSQHKSPGRIRYGQNNAVMLGELVVSGEGTDITGVAYRSQ